MKPRNKYENRVAEINATLHEDIAFSNIEWVKEVSKDWDMSNFCYFTIFDNIQEFEVKRLYRAYRVKSKNQNLFLFVEIAREFNDGTKKLIFTKRRSLGCYFDTFTYGSDIELRKDSANYCGYRLSDLFRLSLDSRSEDYDSKRMKCAYINPKYIARVVRDNPVAENLYKDNDPLFGWLVNNNHPKEFCRAITLAKRHGFVFDDATTPLWFDMVGAIIYCDKDWHNPVFIAPKDMDALYANHDKFITMMSNRQERLRRQRIEELHRIEQEELKRQRERMEADNKAYIRRRRRFYGMVLTDGLIECRVLRNVQEFEEEGNAMKHCVFRCSYYRRPYSLILSARIGGERIETVEVDLTNYTIKQCYGKHDHFTMYHERILKLVNDQMDTIKFYKKRKNNLVRKAV